MLCTAVSQVLGWGCRLGGKALRASCFATCQEFDFIPMRPTGCVCRAVLVTSSGTRSETGNPCLKGEENGNAHSPLTGLIPSLQADTCPCHKWLGSSCYQPARVPISHICIKDCPGGDRVPSRSWVHSNRMAIELRRWSEQLLSARHCPHFHICKDSLVFQLICFKILFVVDFNGS